MKYLHHIITCILCLSSLVTVQAKDDYPTWVHQTNTDDHYYYGVGMAYKQKKSTAHVIEAERTALQKLSEDISLTVKSSQVLVQLETDQQTRDELSAIVKVDANNDVQGYEIVEVFETKKEYWVLCRLSKSTYRQNQRAKHEKAVAEATTHLRRAIDAEKANDIKTAIVSYAKTLDRLKLYYGEENFAYIDNQRVAIFPYSYDKLKKIIQNLQLISPKDEYLAIQGKSADSIQCQAMYNNVPIANVFLKATLVGSNVADIVETTNTSGTAHFTSPTIPPSKTDIKVEFSFDLSSLFDANNVDYIIRRWLAQIYSPKAHTQLKVARASVYLMCEEKNLQANLYEPILTPHFQQALKDMDYDIVDSQSAADYVVKVSTDTHLDYEIDDIYYSKLIVKIQITDRFGTTIYSNTMPTTRGVNISAVRAGINAYHQTVKHVKARYLHFIKDALNYQ